MEEDNNFLLAIDADELKNEPSNPIGNEVETTGNLCLAPPTPAVKTARRKSHRFLKRSKKKKSLTEGDKEGKTESAVSQRPLKKQANHFFAVRVSDCRIIENVLAIQDSIIEKQPLLKSALIAPGTLHITLAVAHLSSSEELLKARQSLEEAAEHFFSQSRAHFPLNLHLSNVGHFNNRVVFARVRGDGVVHLNSLSKALRDRCKNAGITLIDDGESFTPHMTLLKLSKDPRLRKKGIKSVGEHLYESHVESVFGEQLVESVQLLSMTEPKDDYGYYALKGEFHFEKMTMKSSAAEASASARDEARSRMRQLLLGLAVSRDDGGVP